MWHAWTLALHNAFEIFSLLLPSLQSKDVGSPQVVESQLPSSRFTDPVKETFTNPGVSCFDQPVKASSLNSSPIHENFSSPGPRANKDHID